MSLVMKLIVLALVANLIGFSASSSVSIHLFGQTLTPVEQNSPEQNNPETSGQQKLYLDMNCYAEMMSKARADFLSKPPTNEVVKHLLILKCDIKPLIKLFATLLRRLDSSSPITATLEQEMDFTKLTNLAGMDSSTSSAEIWRQYSILYRAVDGYADRAIHLMNLRDFCSFTTISDFSNLGRLTQGSKLLELLNDLVITDYHSHCLVATVKSLPEVPYVVKDVVKIYIEGIEDTRKPDLNDPAYLEMGPGFDIEAAVRREGPLDQVASLMLTMTGDSLKDRFVSSCQSLLMNLEQQWQPMEMMNRMLATDSNTILQLNNLVMHSLIVQRYAQICSKLIEIAA